MTTSPSMQYLADLLADLKAAIAAGDRSRALALAQEIQQGLTQASAEHASLEQMLLTLLAELDQFDLHQFKRNQSMRGRVLNMGKMRQINIGGLNIGGQVDFSVERSTSDTEVIYPLWFGTNRKPEGQGFGSERHHCTTLGRALVSVPAAHRFGETGSSFWQRLRRFDFTDDQLRVQEIAPRGREAFFAELCAEMSSARESGQAPHALVFLHGFNVSFEEAAIRAAQLGVDLKVPGATAFFSWPSRGKVAAYPADEASIEASEPAISAFLEDFCTHCGAEKVHLIAHSMGNRGLLRALQRIAAKAQAQGGVKFGQIFLAAPDVDRDLFLDLARLYPQYAERVTLYASAADKAVHLSAHLHDAPRAGYYAPYTVAPGVDTVAVPDFDVDLLGHSYFAQAEALLHDIYDLMRHGQAPEHRQRLQGVESEGQHFWQLKR
ncbi:alpha/beta hydrolase [Rivihabitans pingtungensis]|uniref:alpha/beta hydrolase n=1 Tax=Rivihabitans pingtungensis TaxID=1054498 RepID=UPI0023533FB7|nr:alpha/beta hydrolase [Rivihabitans pingtungensis]MCK6437201.1 alpha/beta fold hydrolase [Rivihabitans pingtungensis]